MRLTSASEYACLALLAIGESDDWTKRSDIVARFAIPLPFLEQILRRLSAAGFITSRRGQSGGFRLARAASEITIAEVMRAIDGPLAPVRSVSENFYQPTPVEASPAFHSLFREVRDAVAEILEHRTLEDMLHAEQKHRRKGGNRRHRGARATIRRARAASRP